MGTPKKEHFIAGATMVAAGNGAVGPIPLMTTDMDITANDGFFSREIKFAKRWLYQKGVFVQEEPVNPVDTELRSFLQNCRDGQRPHADLEVGLTDAICGDAFQSSYGRRPEGLFQRT